MLYRTEIAYNILVFYTYVPLYSNSSEDVLHSSADAVKNFTFIIKNIFLQVNSESVGRDETTQPVSDREAHESLQTHT